MSGGGGKSGSDVAETSVPDWIKFPAIRNLQRAEDVQRIEYMPYRGAEVAGFTDNQIASFNNNNATARSFGFDAPTDAMSGMPTPELYANGMRGYSSMPLYDEALALTKEAQPEAFAQNEALFGTDVGTTYNPYPTGNPNAGFGGGNSDSSIVPRPGANPYDTSTWSPKEQLAHNNEINATGTGSSTSILDASYGGIEPSGFDYKAHMNQVNSTTPDDIAVPSGTDYKAIVAEMKQKQMANAMSAYGDRTGVDGNYNSPGHPSNRGKY